MTTNTSEPLPTEQAARMLAALGSMPRIAVFRSLLRAGAQGKTISALQADVDIPPTTLKHHLTALVSVGLVEQRRVGREVFCEAKYGDIRRLSGFLLHECCVDSAAVSTAKALPRRAESRC